MDTESEALVQNAIDRTIWKRHRRLEPEVFDDDDDEKEEKDRQRAIDISLFDDYEACAIVLVAHRLSTVGVCLI